MSQQNKKIAFTTVLDDKYLAGFLLTLNSMFQSSRDFNYDLIVLEWGELSDKSKSVIRQLYPSTKFQTVEFNLYESHKYDSTHRKWTYNCNYRFDIFAMTQYDRVVFFDSDILFQIGVEEILKYDVDFGACRAQNHNIVQIGPRIGFDGGLMSIGKKFLNTATRDELIKIANSKAPEDLRVPSRKWVSDEPILNNYFLDKITWLPDEYNFIIAKLDNETIKKKINFQFTGHNKPWYGTELREQFSNYVFHSVLINTARGVLVPLILKKLYKLYRQQVNYLLAKEIDIYKYTGHIKPSLTD